MNNIRLRNTDPKYSLEHIPSEKLITGLYLILDHLLKLQLEDDKSLNSVNEMLGDHVISVLNWTLSSLGILWVFEPSKRLY